MSPCLIKFEYGTDLPAAHINMYHNNWKSHVMICMSWKFHRINNSWFLIHDTENTIYVLYDLYIDTYFLFTSHQFYITHMFSAVIMHVRTCVYLHDASLAYSPHPILSLCTLCHLFLPGWMKMKYLETLTHWGRVTHICVGNLTIIDSDNGLSPGRRQAIIWNNAGILLIRSFGTAFSDILIKIQAFSFKKCIWKCRLRPFVSISMC